MKKYKKRIYWEPYLSIVFLILFLIAMAFYIPILIKTKWWGQFVQFEDISVLLRIIILFILLNAFIPSAICIAYYNDFYDDRIILNHWFRKNLNQVHFNQIIYAGIYKYDTYNPRVHTTFWLKTYSYTTEWIYLFTTQIDEEDRLMFVHTAILSYYASTNYISLINDRGYRETNDFFIWKLSQLIETDQDKFINLFGQPAFAIGVDLIAQYEANQFQNNIPKTILQFYRAIYKHIRNRCFLLPFYKKTAQIIEENTGFVLCTGKSETIYNDQTTEELQEFILQDIYPVETKILIRYNLHIFLFFLLYISMILIIVIAI